MIDRSPGQCLNCGSTRVWHRNGMKDGVQQFKALCLQCHRDGLARQRAKHGGAAARNRIWESANREKALAHRRIESQLRLGNIKKKPCERCGAQNVHAHHDDYSAPLDVMWLCPLHHKERHREIEFAKANSSQALSDSPALPSAPGSHPTASAGQFKPNFPSADHVSPPARNCKMGSGSANMENDHVDRSATRAGQAGQPFNALSGQVESRNKVGKVVDWNASLAAREGEKPLHLFSPPQEHLPFVKQEDGQ